MLIHETTYKGATEIIKSGYIEPNSVTGYERWDEKFNTIFMTVLFDNLKFVDNHQVLFIYDNNLMKKIPPTHWTNSWNWGEFSEEDGVISVKYNKKLSPEDNIKIWNETYNKIYQKKKDFIFDKNYNKNEVVFPKRIPTDSNLVAIYYTGSKPLEHPKLVTSRKDLMKLLNR